MGHQNLLASVALFSELYNSDTYQSIPDVIAEFIQGAIIDENKFSFNSTELKDLLKKVYDFDIPEAVVRTVLRSKFKDTISVQNKIYHVDSSIKKGYEGFEQNFSAINDAHNKIIKSLVLFIEKVKNTKLTETENHRVFTAFIQYIMDDGYSKEYSDLISAFIISNEHSDFFKDQLASIKEGIILYQGINYTGNVSELGSWNSELTIALSTEHLFSCLGYNGELFQEIFNDFFTLVQEINSSVKGNKKKKLIQLIYFKETQNEIEDFFSTAESILKGYLKLDPTKLAMVNILNGCSSPSDVRGKQVLFFDSLKQKGIDFLSFNFSTEDSEFNVVDQTLVDELKEISESNEKRFNEKYCFELLRMFTKINFFRRGNNKLPFENISHIYMTENNFAKYLAHHPKVKFGEHDISFAKDIDFITSKFWFKLKKGFNKKSRLPISFDVITKARIIISSHLNSSLSESYDQLQEKFKKGELTEGQAVSLSASLKEKPTAPEEISEENIDSTMLFIHDDRVIENFLRDQTRKETIFAATIQEKEDLEKKVKEFEEKEDLKNEKNRLAKLENDQREYSLKQWLQYKSYKFTALRYYIFVTVITALPIFIGLGIKIIPSLNNWLKSIGNYQFLVWSGLAIVFVVELQGRSYLFNKEKMKDGWNWLLLIVRFNYKKERIKRVELFKSEFKQL